jgi:prepilin-type N-terminal cleavage/methylation domain-containing protein
MKHGGFTLVEFVVTAAIVGLLGAVAVRAYQQVAERASLAQQLVDIGHIRKVVEIEARGGRRDLIAGSRPGTAPSALAGQLPDRQFQDGKGLRLQLVHMPPDVLRSPGTHSSYGLVADTTGSTERLWLFHREIEKAGFEAAWLSERSFVFSIVDYGEETAAAAPPQVPAVPAPPAAPFVPAETPAPPLATSPPNAPPACGPGEEAKGQSGKCRPVADAGACPPGWHPAGQGGNCRPDRKPGEGR